MKLEQRYELQRKRLDQALEKISLLEDEINSNKENGKRVSQLINELEYMKNEWSCQITELKNKRSEYENLIHQVKEIRKKMIKETK